MSEVTDMLAIYCHRIPHYYMYEGEYYFHISIILTHDILCRIEENYD